MAAPASAMQPQAIKAPSRQAKVRTPINCRARMRDDRVEQRDREDHGGRNGRRTEPGRDPKRAGDQHGERRGGDHERDVGLPGNDQQSVRGRVERRNE